MLRTELLQLRQERDKPFRTFTAKVQGKAETCSYTTSRTCGASVDYTDHVIRDVILNGLYDSNIGREVLGIAGIIEKPVNEVIALVKTKEMGRNALPSPSLSAVSSFVKQKTLSPNDAPLLLRRIGQRKQRAPAVTSPLRSSRKEHVVGTRNPTKCASNATGPIAVKKRHRRQPP